jgi:hypothetical protein
MRNGAAGRAADSGCFPPTTWLKVRDLSAPFDRKRDFFVAPAPFGDLDGIGHCRKGRLGAWLFWLTYCRARHRR